MVGGDYVARNLRCVAMNGRIVNIAFQKGAKVEIDLLPLMLKRLTLTGSTLRPRSVAEKAEIARALEAKVWPLFAAGKCKPVIFKTFPLAQAAEAHRLMEVEPARGQDCAHRLKRVAFGGQRLYSWHSQAYLSCCYGIPGGSEGAKKLCPMPR